jgi:hypothetical protein
MNVLAAIAVIAATLQGTAQFADEPLPGCMVSLQSSSSRNREIVTGLAGTYLLEGVPAGEYTLKFELAGVDSVTRTIRVYDGVNVEDAVLRFDVTDCGLIIATCLSTPPETMFDAPLCADEQADGLVLDAIAQHDPSAVALAQRRFETANTYAQKHKLAAALLRAVPNDVRYWNALYEHASNLVAFPRYEQFEAWCSERDLPAGDYYWMALDALRFISSDARALPLMLKTLACDDVLLQAEGVTALGLHDDPRSLPAIERAIARATNPDDRLLLAHGLASWKSIDADRVAFRFLDEEEREIYREQQQEPEP